MLGAFRLQDGLDWDFALVHLSWLDDDICWLLLRVPDLDHGIGHVYLLFASLTEVVVISNRAFVANALDRTHVATIASVAIVNHLRLLLFDLLDQFFRECLAHEFLDLTLAEEFNLIVVDLSQVLTHKKRVHLASTVTLFAGLALLGHESAIALEARLIGWHFLQSHLEESRW